MVQVTPPFRLSSFEWRRGQDSNLHSLSGTAVFKTTRAGLNLIRPPRI